MVLFLLSLEFKVCSVGEISIYTGIIKRLVFSDCDLFFLLTSAECSEVFNFNNSADKAQGGTFIFGLLNC